MDTATVALPTLNEEDNIGSCLDSIEAAAREAEAWDIEVIVLDADSDDATQSRAYRHPVVDAVEEVAPGLLLARHRAFEHASGDVVVSVDADNHYKRGFLKHLLEPFEASEDVVLTYGTVVGETLLSPDAFVRLPLQYGLPFFDLDWVVGANRAVRTDAYFDSGGFRLEKDGRELAEVMFEEQVHFPHRLGRHGAVQFQPTALSVTAPRMTEQLLFQQQKAAGSPWRMPAPSRILPEVSRNGAFHPLVLPLMASMGVTFTLRWMHFLVEGGTEPPVDPAAIEQFIEDVLNDAFPPLQTEAAS